MILGDNIFYGNGFSHTLRESVRKAEHGIATIVGYYVTDPERFGIVEFDKNGKVISVEEKPQRPKSNYAITGLFFYPPGVSDFARRVKPSDREELDITTLNEMFLNQGNLCVELLGRGFAWLDTGTMDSLLEAGEFVLMIEKKQCIKISVLEEFGYRNGWISRESQMVSADKYGKFPYGQHLRIVAEGKIVSLSE